MKRQPIRRISENRQAEGLYYKVVSEQVKQRDKWMCVMCGKRMWEIAHLVPRWRFGRRDFERKHALKNLACVCRDCHKQTHSFEGRQGLLNTLRERHGYDYREPPWCEYA